MYIEISTDGGCIDNPGPGGSGVFVQVFEKKGGKLTEEIRIHRSVTLTTNNRAELTAAHIAFDLILKEGWKEATVFIDSKYVLNPIEKGWLKTWVANDWTKSDGTPCKNVDLWEPFSILLAKVVKASKLDLHWVRGHSGHHGNETADTLATMGNTLAAAGIEEEKVQRTQMVSETGEPPKLKKFKMSPLLQGPRLYFQSREKPRTDEEGRYIYYTGTHGKEDGDVGKRTHEAQHCITLLKEADPVLNHIVQQHQQVNDGKLGTVATIKLDAACTSKKYNESRNALERGDHLDGHVYIAIPSKDGLTDTQGVQVSRDISPPILGFTCLDTLYTLEQLLRGYLNKTVEVTETDITDVLYDVGVVGKGKNEREKYSLKKTITTSVKVLDLLISTPNDNKRIKLTLGHSLPSRNTLSAVTKDKPSVKVVTWSNGGKSFRLATIIETTEGASLWTAFYSALYFTD